jgi:hypothetical protein
MLRQLEPARLDRVTGGQDAAATDALAQRALDEARRTYGADRVFTIPQSDWGIRVNRANGYWLTWGYVVGADRKIDRWIEGP